MYTLDILWANYCESVCILVSFASPINALSADIYLEFGVDVEVILQLEGSLVVEDSDQCLMLMFNILSLHADDH